MTSERQLSVWAALGLWAASVAGAVLYGAWHGYAGRAFVFTAGVLAFFLAVQLLFAADDLGERLSRRTGSHFGVLVCTTPLCAYLIYLFGTNDFTWWRAALAAAYILAPALLAISAGTTQPGAWQDYLAMLLIFLPLKMTWLNRFWPYPAGAGGAAIRITYVATTLLAVSVALAIFLFIRQLDGVGYTIVWGRGTAVSIVVHFGLLSAIVIPLGISLHFIQFDPGIAQWKTLPVSAMAIFLLTAWPEELIFRGLLQNCLSRTLSSRTTGWITASVLFGLAHITNGGFPNWRYALLAAVAGIFYGSAWRKSGSILPAAVVHALVDTTWHFLFRTL
ncbi:MAG: CPBP family glutamic-type intramembrane protease [Candidatus Acidiferrales bacterium]